MRYWDSSALVPVVVEEAASPACRELLRADGGVAVWVMTRLELVSALQRKARARELARPALRAALERVAWLDESWTEVDAVRVVRDRAERLLGVHPLRAADSLQLAAALTLARERPRGRAFVTCDDRLAEAADAEGFAVIVPAR